MVANKVNCPEGGNNWISAVSRSLAGWGAQKLRCHPPGTVKRRILGPGGELQRGVLSLRTSEFWRPVLGDLEAKDPGRTPL